MAFEKQLPEWNAIGLEPSQNKKNEGWKEREKPPADWFNWIQNKTYEALKELQEKAAEKSDLENIPEPTWENLQGKPETFPPSSHNHGISDIDNLQQALSNLENNIGNLTNLSDEVMSHNADLASQEVGKGADMIGLPDPNSLFTATNVGGAMQELFTNVSDGKDLIGGTIADVDPTIIIPTDPSFQDLANSIGGLLGSAVKSVQHGLEEISGSTTSREVTISSVDPSKSVVFVTVSSNSSSQPSSNTVFACEIINSNTINIERNSGGTLSVLTIAWTVIEFEGVKGVQTGRQASTSNPTVVSINEIDTNKSFLITHVLSTVSSNSSGYTLASGIISSPTSLEFRSFGSSGDAIYVWQVIEFK